jgi:NitT/TauT family transport system ATP-binding protein
MIEVRSLEKVYQTRLGEPVHALTNIDLSIGAGEFVSVVGPSGCGKSTLMRILAGLDNQTSGTAALGGQPIAGPRPDVGVVFQQATLLPWRTVLQNVLLPAMLRGIDRTKRAHELLELVSLSGFAEKYPFELSGGMQQRVAIARSLLLDPELLLMDEPFSSLDAMTRDEMGFELMRIWSERPKTVVFITHSITEAVLLADRVIVLTARPGKIADVVRIPLARPRTMDTLSDPLFNEITASVRNTVFTRARAA